MTVPDHQLQQGRVRGKTMDVINSSFLHVSFRVVVLLHNLAALFRPLPHSYLPLFPKHGNTLPKPDTGLQKIRVPCKQ